MFCPRCGRAVNEGANFCAGCGLPKSEIEKYTAAQAAENTENTAETVSEPMTETPSETETEPVNIQPDSTAEEFTPVIEAQSSDVKEETAQPQSEPGFQAEAKPVTKEDKPLSTLDFLLMMIISGIPFIGLIYLVYLAVQDNNITKRSYGRACLILAFIGVFVGLLFALGFVLAAIFL